MNAYKLLVVREKVGEADEYLFEHYKCSEDVIESNFVRKNLLNSDREKMYILLTNVKNKLIGYEMLSQGSLTASIVHPREAIKSAIIANAANVIFIHNHPSGEADPSTDDIEICNRLGKAFHIMGINVLDFLIIAENGYYSFRQKDLI